MSLELICPECGGVIGGDSTSPDRACTCFKNRSAGSADSGADQQSSSDTFVEKAAVKVCCQCGKELAGKKRLRDSRGYWCYACHKADKTANAPKGVKCADCSRVVNETALTNYEGMRICGPCRSIRKQQAKENRRLSPVKTDAYHQLDKRRLLWLLGVVALLVLIIILRQLKLIGA
jgi:hypothetical protein